MWDAIIILFFHWIADFLLQTTDMAINKSKSNYWLSKHVVAYFWGMSPLILLGMYHSNFVAAIFWLLFNCTLHLITDYCTSRWTSKLYAAKKYYGFPAFFSVIGLDQFIHTFYLLSTFQYFIL